MRFLMAVSLVALSLAGCTDAPAENAAEPVDVVTEPELTGRIDQPHIHDYWGGADELTIIDTEGNMVFTLNGGEYLTRVVQPDEGVVVPQGTSHVVIDLEMSDNQPGPNEHGEPELWIQTPAMNTAVRVGPLSDAPFRFDTTHEDADLPHQVLSAWEVWLRVPPGDVLSSTPLNPNFKSVNMHFDLQMTAVRGLELPVFPPHPDHWGNDTEKVLIDGRADDTFLWLADPPGCTYCDGGIYIIDMDDGAIVPPGTSEVVVFFRNTHNTPTGLQLLYHGADSREWKDAPLESQEGDLHTYRIPVDHDSDGPYSPQSLWQFYFRFDSPTAGFGPYEGDWSMTAHAVKDPDWTLD